MFLVVFGFAGHYCAIRLFPGGGVVANMFCLFFLLHILERGRKPYIAEEAQTCSPAAAAVRDPASN